MKRKIKIDWKKVRQEFIGKGKIAVVRIDGPDEHGTYRLHYEENGNAQWIDSKEKDEMEKILIEFGGKNLDSVSAPDKFLLLNDWSSQDIAELGHSIKQISLTGCLVARENTIPIIFPSSCGSSPISKSKKEKKKQTIEANIIQKDKDNLTFTAKFNDENEFNNLIKFVKNNKIMKNMVFYVTRMVTQNLKSKQTCLWLRTTSGDGIKRMILELRAIDGVSFDRCCLFDLISAADDMADGECKHVPDISKKRYEKLLCYTHASNQK